MTAIDRAALIEAAERRLHRIDCGCPEPDAPDHFVDYAVMVEDSLPVVVAAALKPLRELHADHECGNYDLAFWCHAPYGDGRCVKVGICSHCGDKAPCPTVRLLDQIEADVKGGER